ncbi:MAG: acyl carrier protein [Lachnospiraceae bacterium]
MNREEILEKINEICRDVFENDDIVVVNETTADDIEEWDSLTHITLINEIEMEFNVKFTMGEIQGAKNVGELIDYLIHHMS